MTFPVSTSSFVTPVTDFSSSKVSSTRREDPNLREGGPPSKKSKDEPPILHPSLPLLPNSGKKRSCTLMAKYVRLIASGKKTYEGRVYTKMFQNFNEGDTVTWFAGRVERVVTRIIEKQVFATFKEMVEKIGYEVLVPDAPSNEAAIAIYENIPEYLTKAQKNGVVAFKLHVLP